MPRHEMTARFAYRVDMPALPKMQPSYRWPGEILRRSARASTKEMLRHLRQQAIPAIMVGAKHRLMPSISEASSRQAGRRHMHEQLHDVIEAERREIIDLSEQIFVNSRHNGACR